MVTNKECYTDEWKRSDPDIVVYLPKYKYGPDNDNEHFLVFHTFGGDMLAFWTQGSWEGAPDQHIACAWSEDDGLSWSKPIEIAGPGEEKGRIASWAFPVVSKAERIYCFYNKNVGIVDCHHQFTGVMMCQYSDDGRTWSSATKIPFNRRSTDHPDPNVPANWIAWQKPIRDSYGRWIVGFTRWTSTAVRPTPINGWEADSRVELMRFDNIDEGPDPEDIKITWLPKTEPSICVFYPSRPEISVAQEPSIVLLPDRRLFMVVRTLTGRIWYTVSENDGETWCDPEVLRYKDNGDEVLQPICCCPIYPLKDGRYILLYHNNDGTANGGTWPGSSDVNRHPAFLTLGKYRPNAHQPIWFSKPKKFLDTDHVPIGPQYRVEIATYTSFTEKEGKRILWYPDRKHFLLGKYVTDEWLADMNVPE